MTDWPTTTGPWKRLTPGPLWYAIGEGCQESAEEAKDCAKESLGRWLVDFCRSFFLTVPIGLFNPLPCCSTLWVLHFSDVCCIRFPGSLSINACTHRGIGRWAASLGFWDILCGCIKDAFLGISIHEYHTFLKYQEISISGLYVLCIDAQLSCRHFHPFTFMLM